MRKKWFWLSVILTVFAILMTRILIYLRGGINELKWTDYCNIVCNFFLAGVSVRAFFNLVYYQKKIIENYQNVYKKFRELHKIRYKMYFSSSIDKEKIEKCTQLLNKYVSTLLYQGAEIQMDEDYPISYRNEVNEIITETLKLANQVQS